MTEKRKGRSLNAIYCNPLPVTLSVDLYGRHPMMTLANPISWMWMLYRVGRMYLGTLGVSKQKYEVDVVTTRPDVVFQIHSEDDMNSLWKQGFFGKGTLSRSDPTWRHRAQNSDQNVPGTPKEDVTKARRDDRKTFKKLRSRVQHFEALERQRSLTTEEKEELVQTQKQMELMRKPQKGEGEKEGKKGEGEEENKKVGEKGEDKKQENAYEEGSRDGIVFGGEISKVDMDSRLNLESLQLQKVELFFLAFALDVVKVVQENRELSLEETFRACMQDDIVAHNRFLLEYVVYHHFRSLGWCVKSGIKFGTHMLLYKRGPPFSHAEYAVLVIANDGREWSSWEDFMAIARVVTGVKKTLVLVYVDMPCAGDFSRLTSGKLDSSALNALLRSYRVTEVIYRRWSPSRTRD